jgi:hypothetical protein
MKNDRIIWTANPSTARQVKKLVRMCIFTALAFAVVIALLLVSIITAVDGVTRSLLVIALLSVCWLNVIALQKVWYSSTHDDSTTYTITRHNLFVNKEGVLDLAVPLDTVRNLAIDKNSNGSVNVKFIGVNTTLFQNVQFDPKLRRALNIVRSASL